MVRQIFVYISWWLFTLTVFPCYHTGIGSIYIIDFKTFIIQFRYLKIKFKSLQFFYFLLCLFIIKYSIFINNVCRFIFLISSASIKFQSVSSPPYIFLFVLSELYMENFSPCNKKKLIFIIATKFIQCFFIVICMKKSLLCAVNCFYIMFSYKEW